MRRSLGLGLLLVSPGCGDSAPQYTSQQVMYEVERAKLAVEGALYQPDALDQALAAARDVERWMQDPAVERYIASLGLPGEPEQYAGYRKGFDGALNELIEATTANDLGRSRRAYATMLVHCATCHAVYRPDL